MSTEDRTVPQPDTQPEMQASPAPGPLRLDVRLDAAAGITEVPKRYCPSCDNLVRKDFKPGPDGKPGRACPRCGCLERHRFFALLLALLRPGLGDVGALLEISPSPHSRRQLDKLDADLHMSLDIGYDGRLVDILGSLTALPLDDATVDLLVCYHVLEHVPDDLAAMREIARVLAPGGTALLQVPWRPGTLTDEDPDAPVEERIRRFGQRDHIRFYGDDLESRLTAAGLTFERVTPRSVVGEAMAAWCRLVPTESVWIVHASATPPPTVPAAAPAGLGHSTPVEAGTLSAALASLVHQIGTERTDLLAARERVRRLQAAQAAQAAAATPPAPAPMTPGRVARGVVRRVRGRLPSR